MRRVALVTGGTGLLGSWIVRSLLKCGYEEIYVLARGDSQYSAEARVQKALNAHQVVETNGNLLRKIKVIIGDICRPRLGLQHRTIRTLFGKITDIFHTAATADFKIPIDAIRVPNVQGTKHICQLVLLDGRIKSKSLRIHHISTVFVAGTLEDWFREDQFACGQQFHNSYERSKFEAEQVVREYRNKGAHIIIYRPGIITGDSVRGITTNFKMVYQPLRLIAGDLFPELPANEHSIYSLVPVDRVAEAICLLSQTEQLPNGSWHLVNPYEISAVEFLDAACQVFKCRRPVLIPVEHFPRERLSSVQWSLIEPFVPYFNYRLRFQAHHTIAVLKSLGFEWPRMDNGMLKKLFHYCMVAGFIRPALTGSNIEDDRL